MVAYWPTVSATVSVSATVTVTVTVDITVIATVIVDIKKMPLVNVPILTGGVSSGHLH